IDTRHFPHVAQIDRLTVFVLKHELPAKKNIFGAEIERLGASAEFLDAAREALIDFVGQDLLHNLERLFIRVAATPHKPRLDAGLLHRPTDGSPTAVHHHGLHPNSLHKKDVKQQVGYRPLLFHHTSAQFDDGDLAAEGANPA